jgi:hypothetical protein
MHFEEGKTANTLGVKNASKTEPRSIEQSPATMSGTKKTESGAEPRKPKTQNRSVQAPQRFAEGANTRYF